MKNSLRAEVYQDLENFKETRRSVNELLKYKRGLTNHGQADLQKVNEMKGRVITAIDNLFAENSDIQG